jgi:hypothetical protein
MPSVAAPSKNGSRTAKTTYADGRPFDELHYLQAKLLLKPDRLSSPDRFGQLGKLVQRTAKSMELGLIDNPEAAGMPRVREIVFLDTPDFRLYKNGFILRRRVRYVDGFPVGDPEIVFKYRGTDFRHAAALDVRPRIDGHYRIKFKLQALPAHDHVGGYRLLYSHNCQFGVSQAHDRNRTAMSTLTRIFPAMATLKKSNTERIRIVNEGIVEELLFPLPQLDFGKGFVAKSDVALWRTRGTHAPIVGEYAFQVKFEHRDDVPKKTEKLVKQFFVNLQHQVHDWIALGKTKTGLVYGLNGKPVNGHE